MTPFNHTHRRTINALGGCFGADKSRRLVVTLEPGTDSRPDMIVMRPEGTRREHRMAVVDCYRLAIRAAANLSTLAKARDRKLAKQASRERRRIDAQERRFRNTIKGGGE